MGLMRWPAGWQQLKRIVATEVVWGLRLKLSKVAEVQIDGQPLKSWFWYILIGGFLEITSVSSREIREQEIE